MAMNTTDVNITSSADWTNWLQSQSIESKQPLAAVVRVGGSGVDMAVSGLHKDPIHIDIKAERSKSTIANHTADLKVVKEILATCVKQAKAVSQPIMDLVFGVAGYATNAKENVALNQLCSQVPEEGHIYMANANDKAGLNWDALGDMRDIANGAEISLSYRDEAMNDHIDCISNLDTETGLRATVLNDTVAIAASAGQHLKEGENALGLVDGTGFNLGIGEDYDTRTGQFRRTQNTESGQPPLPNTEANQSIYKFKSPLDAIYEGANKDLNTEEVLAGGSLVRQCQTLKSILENATTRENMLNIPNVLLHLNKYLPVEKQLAISIINGTHKLTVGTLGSPNFIEYNPKILQIVSSPDLAIKDKAEEIEKEAKKGDSLALALTLSLAERSANFTITKFADFLKNSKTTAFAMVGSHLLHGILEVPGGENAFIGTIQKFRAKHGLNDLKILKHDRGAMDGLIDVLEGKMAMARLLYS